MDSTYEMVKELIDFNSEGVDTYNHNGSTWLIFTDNKKWVIELTKEKTLWYNYYFFTGVFKYLSLDVVENQHYITKWVEDTVINGVKSTQATPFETRKGVEDTIENGVKHTEKSLQIDYSCVIEDVIKEGVKHTEYGDWLDGDERFDDIIDNGIKETHDDAYHHTGRVGGVIKNGVKETKSIDYSDNSEFIVDGVISGGVKKSPI